MIQCLYSFYFDITMYCFDMGCSGSTTIKISEIDMTCGSRLNECFAMKMVLELDGFIPIYPVPSTPISFYSVLIHLILLSLVQSRPFCITCLKCSNGAP